MKSGSRRSPGDRIPNMRRVPTVLAIVVCVPLLVAGSCDMVGGSLSPNTSGTQAPQTANADQAAPAATSTPAPPTPTPDENGSNDELVDGFLGLPPAPTLTPFVADLDPGVRIGYADNRNYRLDLRWRLAGSGQPWESVDGTKRRDI